MSSNKWIIAAIAGVIVLALYTYVEPKFNAPNDPKTAISDQHPKFNLHPEVDKTDIFAIPLDNSEEDDDVTLTELEEGYPPKK